MSLTVSGESNDTQRGAGSSSSHSPTASQPKSHTSRHDGREVTVEQVWAPDVRDQVLDLLQSHHHWPAKTRQEHDTLWQWRYTSLTERPPATWVVRATGVPGIVGHIAMFTRYYRLGTQELVATVPADVIVHRDWRRLGVGQRLIEIILEHVQQASSDFVVAFATPDIHGVLRRAGYHDFGGFRESVELRKSRAYLRERWRFGGALAPAVDTCLKVRRQFYTKARHLARWSQRFRIAPLSVDDFDMLDRGHWRYPADRVVTNDSVDFIRARFAESRSVPHTFIGIWDRRTDRLEGYVIARAVDGKRPGIMGCQTNFHALDVPTAIALVAETSFETAAVWVVATAGDNGLVQALERFGLITRLNDAPHPFRVFVYWSPQHPLATCFASPGCWTFLPGAAEF